MRKSYNLFFLFLLLRCFSANAQLSVQQQLAQYQDSLKSLGDQVVNNQSEPERYNANYKMIKTLVSALKLHNSFSFGFDSLKTISVQTSPDRRFRIFSWHVLNNDGSYRYYGTIQMNTGGAALQMFPLVDHSPEIKNPQDSLLNSNHWYGCQYYKIIPVTYNVRVPYYILLGWKGNTVKTTKKVIEVLSFKDNKALFGMQVFEAEKKYAAKYRVIFEYSRGVSMLLNYVPEKETIVFDHLVAASEKMEGKPEFYGPDLSYDGFKLERGRWRFVDNIEMKNAPNESDNLYIDPKKAPKEIINKIK